MNFRSVSTHVIQVIHIVYTYVLRYVCCVYIYIPTYVAEYVVKSVAVCKTESPGYWHHYLKEVRPSVIDISIKTSHLIDDLLHKVGCGLHKQEQKPYSLVCAEMADGYPNLRYYITWTVHSISEKILHLFIMHHLFKLKRLFQVINSAHNFHQITSLM